MSNTLFECDSRKSEHQSLVDLWCAIWEKRYGAKFPFLPRHAREIKAIRQACGQASAEVLKAYIADGDKYLLQDCHPLYYLLNHLPRYMRKQPKTSHTYTEDDLAWIVEFYRGAYIADGWDQPYARRALSKIGLADDELDEFGKRGVCFVEAFIRYGHLRLTDEPQSRWLDSMREWMRRCSPRVAPHTRATEGEPSPEFLARIAEAKALHAATVTDELSWRSSHPDQEC